MDPSLAIQGASIWILLLGSVVLVFAIIAYWRIERISARVNTLLFWMGGVLLSLSIIGLLTPYIVVFLGARPI